MPYTCSGRPSHIVGTHREQFDVQYLAQGHLLTTGSGDGSINLTIGGQQSTVGTSSAPISYVFFQQSSGHDYDSGFTGCPWGFKKYV